MRGFLVRTIGSWLMERFPNFFTDLDRDKKQLLQLLESQVMRDNGSIHSTGTRRTRGRGLGHGDNSGAGQDLIRRIQPQMFLLIQGEDQFAPPPAEPVDTGCQCIIC